MREPTTLRHLAPLFRGPFLRKVATGRYYTELYERLSLSKLQQLLELPLSNIFDRVYDILMRKYRCEYIFKNSLTQHFLQRQMQQDCVHITDEFRVGKSRVDLAVFSEACVAYEIKTEFDSSFRLSSQTSEYIKLFDKVYVVTTKRLRSRMQPFVPKSVGILELSEAGEFLSVRESESHAHTTDLSTAFDCLRQKERLAVAQTVTNDAIRVPSSELYAECKKRFRRLLPFEAQQYVLHHLRARRLTKASETLLTEVPLSLKHSAITLRASMREIDSIRRELANIPQIHHTPPKHYVNVLPISKRKTTRNDGTQTVERTSFDGVLSAPDH